MGEHVLDMGLLEKPQAAANRIGNAASQELALQEDAVVMIAIEYGHLAQLQALFPGFEDLLANERGFFIGICGGDEQREAAIGPSGYQDLCEPRRIVGDRGPGECDDLGRRPIVDFELEDPRPGCRSGNLRILS